MEQKTNTYFNIEQPTHLNFVVTRDGEVDERFHNAHRRQFLIGTMKHRVLQAIDQTLSSVDTMLTLR